MDLHYALEKKQHLAALSGLVSGFFGGGVEAVKLTVRPCRSNKDRDGRNGAK
jgi:hypothetical protein